MTMLRAFGVHLAHLRQAIAILVMSALAAVTLGSVLFEANFSHCLSTWATNWTSRSSQLQRASDARTAALDQLVRSVAEIRNDPALFEQDLATYIAASNAYTLSLERHPIPQPPIDTC